MTKQVTTRTPVPIEYVPVRSDPVRLASVTMQAVDKIGIAAAEEIDQTAGKVLEGAAEVAGMLRELANVLREQSKLANERVTDFCGKATTVIEGVRDLHIKIGGELKVEDPLPSVVAKGPLFD